MKPPAAEAPRLLGQLEEIRRRCGHDVAPYKPADRARFEGIVARLAVLRKLLAEEWVIRSATEKDDASGQPLYWSNDDGWVARETATRFTTEERSRCRVPVGADEWERA